MAGEMVMVGLCKRVAAMAMPKVPFCMPVSMDMVMLCDEWRLNILADTYPSTSMTTLSASATGPA